MNRGKLVNILNQLKPCIKKNPFIPKYSLISFKDTTIEVFNGVQGMKAEFDIGLNCAVDSTDFYKIILSMTGDEVELVQLTEHLLVKCGRSVYKLELDESASYFPVDDEIKYKRMPVGFVEGVKKCLKFASKNLAEEEKYGVTVNNSMLYSTNDVGVASYDLNEDTGLRHVLPEPFLKMIMGLEGENILLGANDEGVLAVGDNVKIFTLINKMELLNYADILSGYNIDEINLVEISQELRDVVERFTILGAKEVHMGFMGHTNDITLHFEGKGISSTEEVSLELDKDFNSKFEVALLSRLIDNSWKLGIFIKNKDVVLTGVDGEFTCLVANIL